MSHQDVQNITANTTTSNIINTDVWVSYNASRGSFSQTYYDDTSCVYSSENKKNKGGVKIKIQNITNTSISNIYDFDSIPLKMQMYDFSPKDNNSIENIEENIEENFITKNMSQEEMEYELIEEAICTSDKNPYRIHAQLSQHKQYYARKALMEFFETNMRIVFIGSSSGESRSHSVYRGRDGRLYNVHKSAYGDGRMDVFYFTEGDIAWAFEDNPEGKPDWTMSDDVKREIKKMNGYNEDNTESETDEDMPSMVDDSDTDDQPMALPIGRSVSEAINRNH